MIIVVMMVIFETARLLCRRLTPEDFAALLEVYGDAEAMRYVGDGSPLTATGRKAYQQGLTQVYEPFLRAQNFPSHHQGLT